MAMATVTDLDVSRNGIPKALAKDMYLAGLSTAAKIHPFAKPEDVRTALRQRGCSADVIASLSDATVTNYMRNTIRFVRHK